MPCYGVDQRTVVVSASRMHYQSGRFVDYHQIVVLIDYIQWNIFGNDIIIITWTVHHHRQHVARLYFITAFHRFAVRHDKTGVGSLLNTVARRVDKPFEQIFVHAHL